MADPENNQESHLWPLPFEKRTRLTRRLRWRNGSGPCVVPTPSFNRMAAAAASAGSGCLRSYRTVARPRRPVRRRRVQGSWLPVPSISTPGNARPSRASRRSHTLSASVSGYGPEILSSSHSPATIGASRSHSRKQTRRLSRMAVQDNTVFMVDGWCPQCVRVRIRRWSSRRTNSQPNVVPHRHRHSQRCLRTSLDRHRRCGHNADIRRDGSAATCLFEEVQL